MSRLSNAGGRLRPSASASQIRVHRIPFSTNVERVALAAGIKGVEVEWVDHDPADRSAIAALSGQELVPVAEFDGEVVADSMRIVDRLERLAPEPALYPDHPASRAMVAIFIDWFDEVWKGPPNAIDDEREKAAPDDARIAGLLEKARAFTGRFEGMLAAHPFLMSSESPGAADVCAFPFLKYAVAETPPGDVETFHPILEECLKPAEDYPRLRDWVARVDALPRA
jgi:maleylpyruvate isomerase